MRWIGAIGGPIIIVLILLGWGYLTGLACAFGSPNGRCQSYWSTLWNSEAAVFFWVPLGFGIWLTVMGFLPPRRPRWVQPALWCVPAGLLIFAWVASRPSGYFYGQAETVRIGLETYFDHPVVVTSITLNGEEIFFPRPEAVKSSADRRGPRWGDSQPMERRWPIARNQELRVRAHWVDLRSGEAWAVEAVGALDDVLIDPNWSSRKTAVLGLVFGPNGTFVVASDHLAAREEWRLTPVDVARACGQRDPQNDRTDWVWEEIGIYSPEQKEALLAPSRPVQINPIARIPQPVHLCP